MTISFPLLAADGLLTREIFGNIPAIWKGLFYALAAVSLLLFAYGLFRRVSWWRLGREDAPRPASGTIVKNALRNVLLQRRVRGRGLASVAHLMLFTAFLVLLIGTTLIAVEHGLASLLGRTAEEPVFHHGVYYAVYETVMDTFGIVLLIGGAMFIWRRLRRPPSLAHNTLDWIVLAAWIVIGLTGFAVEGLRIVREETPLPGFSFAGLAAARALAGLGITRAAADDAHFLLWWLHAVAALALIAAFPYTRLLHALAGAMNLAVGQQRLGVMTPVSIEELEETGTVGAGGIRDFTRRQLRELDACVACGRCQEACPAFAAGKPLSPRDLVQDIRGLMTGSAKQKDTTEPGLPELHGATIAADTLWSCTTCATCVDVCPLGINPLGFITDMRRFLVGEGQLRGAPANALQKTGLSGNPWGLPAADRFAWAADLHVPTVAERPDFDVLYWVGCAAAYDRRVQKVARSMIQLLTAAGVRYAVLGEEERCTGESARRMGDEFLFQQMAETNVQSLTRHGVKKIVTHCPHCFNSFRHDYPQFGGHFEVVHHSEFLAQLVADGKLKVDPEASPSTGAVTFHDPCYLARVNGISEAPRSLIGHTATSTAEEAIAEMPRHGRQSACCGAGGGRMWFDDTPEERVGADRVEEALATGARTIAVACPFCLIMMGDGVAASGKQAEVRDVAELLAAALGDSCQQDTPGTTNGHE